MYLRKRLRTYKLPNTTLECQSVNIIFFVSGSFLTCPSYMTVAIPSLSSSPRAGHQSQRPLGQAKKFLSSDGKQACPLSSQTIPSLAQVLAESLQTAPSTYGSSPPPPRQLNQLRCPPPPLRCLPGSQSPTCAPPKVFEEAQLCLAASAYQRTAVWKKIWNQ